MQAIVTQHDDEALLAGLRQGDARAFEQLMRRYNRLLFRAARAIVRDDAEAQDVVQEAWLRAFLGLRSFRGEASLGSWLTRIATNQAITHHRKRGEWVSWDGCSDDLPPDPGELEPPHPVQLHSAEDEVARLELRRLLERAIDLLPPIYRSVFILRAVHGLTVEDTAAGLQVSPDVVKTRFLRARALLRARLQADPEGGAAALHDFGGCRCEAIVQAVLAQLRAHGWLRTQQPAFTPP
jgi:RNA polymerase sigma-70 factor (ECF subfamily)